MSLATVVLAVCATLSTFKGGGYSTQSVITQALASDQWAFYQAKSTKQHIYELQSQYLRLQLLTMNEHSPARVAFTRKAEEYEAQVTRYNQEKGAIEAKAHEL